MGESYLGARLEVLRRTQNPDGGWGFFPAKQSWLESTFYAALALHGEPAADRAWTLLKSWQGTNGSWRPAADVQIESWGTSLCITMATVRGEFGDPFRKGVQWLRGIEGAELPLIPRTAARLGLFDPGMNLNLKGWPWKPNTASWVEPTAHALVALKKASEKCPEGDLTARVRLGEAQLMDVRCKDGGWNYGSRSALKVDLPSYPETTALALIGLQAHADLGKSLDLAAKMARETSSPLALAWLKIALRLHGVDVSAEQSIPASPDLMMTALSAVAESNFKFLGTGGAV